MFIIHVCKAHLSRSYLLMNVALILLLLLLLLLLLINPNVLYPLELTNAYNVLRNLTSRREYDKEIGTYFTMRSAKKKQTEEKVLRLTDEMLEIDMKGIRQVLYVYFCKNH